MSAKTYPDVYSRLTSGFYPALILQQCCLPKDIQRKAILNWLQTAVVKSFYLVYNPQRSVTQFTDELFVFPVLTKLCKSRLAIQAAILRPFLPVESPYRVYIYTSTSHYFKP